MLISVVTINFNNLEGLKLTMQSVRNQEYSPLEYIIIDGGSTDGSSAYIEAQRKSGDKFISEPDKGIYDGQNKGLAIATGRYVIFLNSGDRFYNEFTLSILGNAVSSGREIVYGNIYVEQPNGVLFLKEYPDRIMPGFFEFDTLPHPCSLIPVQLLRSHGGYDTSLLICADWKFFRRVWMAKQATFVHVSEAKCIFDGNGFSANNRHIILSERQRVKSTDKRWTERIIRKANQWAGKLGIWLPRT